MKVRHCFDKADILNRGFLLIIAMCESTASLFRNINLCEFFRRRIFIPCGNHMLCNGVMNTIPHTLGCFHTIECFVNRATLEALRLIIANTNGHPIPSCRKSRVRVISHLHNAIVENGVSCRFSRGIVRPCAAHNPFTRRNVLVGL